MGVGRRCRRLAPSVILLAASLVSAGCGGGAASGQTGSGGIGGGRGTAGPGATGGAGGGDAVVAAGTCGVSRRTPVLGSPATGTTVQRVANGFAIGPWNIDGVTPTPPQWARLDPLGPTLTEYAGGPGSAYRPMIGLNIGAADQIVGVDVGPSDPSSIGDSLYQSTVLRNGEVMPTSPVTLVSAFFRGTIQYAGVAALDGQQGLFMIGHIAVEDPKLAVIGEDGARVGDVGVLATTGVWSCETALPTAHAGAFYLVDQTPAPESAETFHLLEMAPAGGVALEVQMPIDRAVSRVGDNFLPPCPLVALAPEGFVFLSYELEADRNGVWHLHRIARDGTIADEVWDTLPGPPVALAVIGDSAVAVSAVSDGTTTVVKRTNGQDQQFPLAQSDAVWATRIPSEVGTLFLRGHVLDASGAVTTTDQIVEIRCP